MRGIGVGAGDEGTRGGAERLCVTWYGQLLLVCSWAVESMCYRRQSECKPDWHCFASTTPGITGATRPLGGSEL